jgi:hypothetical protein
MKTKTRTITPKVSAPSAPGASKEEIRAFLKMNDQVKVRSIGALQQELKTYEGRFKTKSSATGSINGTLPKPGSNVLAHHAPWRHFDYPLINVSSNVVYSYPFKLIPFNCIRHYEFLPPEGQEGVKFEGGHAPELRPEVADLPILSDRKLKYGAAIPDRGQFSLGVGIGMHPTAGVEYKNESTFFIFENNYVSATLLKCINFPDLMSSTDLKVEIRVEGKVPYISSPIVLAGWYPDPLNGIVGIDANISLFTLSENLGHQKLFQFGQDSNGSIGSYRSGDFLIRGSTILKKGFKNVPIFLKASLNAFRGAGVKNGFAGIDFLSPLPYEVAGNSYGPITITKIVVDLCSI